MGRVKHEDPSRLTPELWAKVFAYLENRPGTIRPVDRWGGSQARQNATAKAIRGTPAQAGVQAVQ